MERLATILFAISVIMILLLQFLPAKLTVSEGTRTNLATWRPVVWQLPAHMLSPLGKVLRTGSIISLSLGILVYAVLALYD